MKLYKVLFGSIRRIYIFHTMNVQVSIGEAIDKHSILQLKLQKITNVEKKTEVEKELLGLNGCLTMVQEYDDFYNQLMYVNNKIWDMTDTIKTMDISNPEFAKISNDIFELNQKRFRIKRVFNMLYDSNIKEQKSYSETHCKIIIENNEILMHKIAEINYLILEYEWVSFKTPCIDRIKQIFRSPTIICDNELKETQTINLTDFVISDELKNIYDLPPIVYVASGSLGDFIHQLSIINEIFILSGRKGVLYISTMRFHFNFGLERAYKDTYEIIKQQQYIKDYQIYNNQPYDVDLSLWRTRRDLYDTGSWYNTFKTVYGVEWATHQWLDIKQDDKWKDFVLINTIPYRDLTNIDFKEVYEKYGSSLLFITNKQDDYDKFKATYGIDVPIYIPNSFLDTCVAIRSCKLFIGSLSGFLTIAHATHIVPHVIGMSSCPSEIVRMLDIDTIIPTAKFII